MELFKDEKVEIQKHQQQLGEARKANELGWKQVASLQNRLHDTLLDLEGKALANRNDIAEQPKRLELQKAELVAIISTTKRQVEESGRGLRTTIEGNGEVIGESSRARTVFEDLEEEQQVTITHKHPRHPLDSHASPAKRTKRLITQDFIGDDEDIRMDAAEVQIRSTRPTTTIQWLLR